MSVTRRNSGRMAPIIDGFEARLFELGYTPGSVRNILKLIGLLGRWMAEVDVEVERLDDALIEVFLAEIRNRRARRAPSTRALRPLLEHLRNQGILKDRPSPTTPLDQLIAEYRTWLVIERGLAAPTVLRYENLASRFLQDRVNADRDRSVNLTGADVTTFLLCESARVSVGTAKGRVAELRLLLRFLHLKGLTPTSLAVAVPPVAGWHGIGVPIGLAASDVDRLLDACDRSDPGGVRDFAILALVARLGLRSIEVARLELGDIDWRAGEIVVRGKARRRDRLPLPWQVGEALSAYLCEVRPPVPIREVFLALKAPVRAIRPDLVSDVTRRACTRAGLEKVGAHRLRHGLATEMLHRGAKLAEISQVLRHRDLATTAIYAKVDIEGLRQVAQPWPGARQ